MREKNVNARDIMERRLAARAIDGGKNCGCWVQRHIGASECRTMLMLKQQCWAVLRCRRCWAVLSCVEEFWLSKFGVSNIQWHEFVCIAFGDCHFVIATLSGAKHVIVMERGTLLSLQHWIRIANVWSRFDHTLWDDAEDNIFWDFVMRLTIFFCRLKIRISCALNSCFCGLEIRTKMRLT